MADLTGVATRIANTKDSGLSDAYNTYSFITSFQRGVYSKKLGRTKTSSDYHATTAANLAGFYFEACFYQAFVGYVNGQNSVTKNSVDFTGSQKDAMNYFNSKHLGGTNEKKFLRLKQTVQSSAVASAKLVFDELMKKFTKVTKNNHTYYMQGDVLITPDKISIVNIAGGQESRGAEAGDFEIAINGTKHTLELKWQSSAKTATRWTEMVDSHLFAGNTFATYNQQTDIQKKYWSHKIPNPPWGQTIAEGPLASFLNSRFDSPSELIRYLLSKGYVGPEDSDYFFDSKFILHAGYTGITFVGLPELAEQLSMGAKGAAGRVQGHKEMWGYSVTKDGVPAIGLGLARYQAKKESSEDQPDRPKENDFSFAIYIAQKQLTGLSLV